MNIQTLTLPSYWACALLYGETDYLGDEEEAAIHAVLAGEFPDGAYCISVGDEDDEGAGFRRYHDAQPYGVLASDCLIYTFDVRVP